MKDFKEVRLSYKNTPIDVRGKFSLTQQECEELLKDYQSDDRINELLFVSTCNRTEAFYVSDEDMSVDIIQKISNKKGVDIKEAVKYFESDCDPLQVQNHLFRVALGLEAQVVGDIQISNQVKRAYQWTADNNMAGQYLHRLMHTIFSANKRVQIETEFRDGAASVSYAAVEMIDELTLDITDPKVLVVGLGEIGTDAVRNLQNTDISDVTIMNRTLSVAEELAEDTGYKIRGFEELWHAAKEADVIISSLPIADYFNVENVKDLDILAFKCFLDLSVPRSVAEEVDKIPGVLVYTVDDINARADKALERRLNAIPKVEAIINDSLVEFNKRSKEMEYSPIIKGLKNALECIREKEVLKYQDQLSTKEQKQVDKITKNLLNKIMKVPVLQLKASASVDKKEGEKMGQMISELFNIDIEK
ncbi:glutamyl-tRNA reductase [Flammeovirga kamogawensis]|uniref:Glutamyl-tRNA reductase n=1 Tax=Flammeovirga kamogawensis TaxID=373891 RepID=A0ABX8GU90_9BACT|nr:glutamyl-tRNA reductase [Flammeovirga kamogawensis]MBB6459989.1 glutamyl-tRNA reductase [Flammeovirga kamogawensis]QWG06963.1 glutamyl-tRNA reductase [Flammeovirga kamogawensis]TRX68783.1 glutamyl-tRNA reductase [Flammeovirga kamogawensis]